MVWNTPMNEAHNDQAESVSVNNGPAQAALLVFLSVQGTVGNIFILAAVITDHSLHTFTDVLILNVAIMDLVVTMVLIPSMLPLLIAEKNVYPHALCQVIGKAGFKENKDIKSVIAFEFLKF